MKFRLEFQFGSDDHLPYFAGLNERGERLWMERLRDAKPADKCVVDALLDAYGQWDDVRIEYVPWERP